LQIPNDASPVIARKLLVTVAVSLFGLALFGTCCGCLGQSFLQSWPVLASLRDQPGDHNEEVPVHLESDRINRSGGCRSGGTFLHGGFSLRFQALSR
jgi:hypothetical protein